MLKIRVYPSNPKKLPIVTYYYSFIRGHNFIKEITMNYKTIIFILLMTIGSIYYIASTYVIPFVTQTKQNQLDYQAYQEEQIMK